MKDVWLVFYHVPCEKDQLEGVFSSEKFAKSYLDEVKEKCKKEGWNFDYQWYSVLWYAIDEKVKY